MTETTAPAPARANRHGDPCPPWCTVDHETPNSSGHTYEFHGSKTVRIEVRGALASIPDRIYVRAVSDGQPGYGKQQVSLSGTVHGSGREDPNVWLGHRDAEDVAGMIEMLAAATPGQHRALAAAIRAAAAAIAEAGGA